MKTLAMYLPQYYRTKENDEWWGDGYTDWVAVKKATPLFEGHVQPKVPLNENYYNLMDKKTMQWQADLAKEYGIDGFCMYHYWFKDGKKVLEKPAENLLKWKEIDFPFCFSWANQSWIRTWSNVKDGNVWTNIDEKGNETEKNGILLEQRYGREQEWKAHFEYLLPFFKDERYIKLDGKPVFIFYQANDDILCLNQMFWYWKKLAKSSGLLGLYIIAANCNENKWSQVDALLMQEISHTTVFDTQKFNALMEKRNNARVYDYDEFWKINLKRKVPANEKIYFCGCVNFDTTPRLKEPTITYKSTPEKFYSNFSKLLEKSIQYNNEFVFINAWNEWGEGMYLEPDEEFGYGYLEAVKKIKDEFSNIKNSKLSNIVDDKIAKITNMTEGNDDFTSDDELELLKSKNSKLYTYINIYERWLDLVESDFHLADYCKKYNYNNVAIYGLGNFGSHLMKQLIKQGVNVKFAINKNWKSQHFETYLLGEKIPEIDAIIVMPILEYKELEEILLNEYNTPVFSIQDILEELEYTMKMGE